MGFKRELTLREKVLLAVLGLLLIFFGGRYFYLHVITPRSALHQQNAAEIVQLKQKIADAEELIASADEEEARYQAAKEKWEAVNKAFATEMRDGLFLVNFGLKLNEQRVGLVSFIPKEIIDQKIYLVLPIEIVLRGDYLNVIELLDFLENQSNLTEINNLTIVQDDEYPDGRVQAEMVLLIYSQRSPQGKLALTGIQNWHTGRANPFAGAVMMPTDKSYLPSS